MATFGSPPGNNLLTVLCETPSAVATSFCVAPNLSSAKVRSRLMDTNSASSKDGDEPEFSLGNGNSYFFLPRFAFDSATLTVLGVVSQIAAISFGVSPARLNRLARSVKERMSGLTESARSLIKISILPSILLVVLSVTG